MLYRTIALVLWLMSHAALAQNINLQDLKGHDFGDQRNELSQKFRMADYLFNSPLRERMHESGNALARGLLEKAEKSFQLANQHASKSNWLEANALIDSVLRDLKNSASLLNKLSLDRNKFEETQKRVKAFVYPIWQDLSRFDQALLDDTNNKVASLSEQVDELAQQEKYDDATKLLLEIYSLKSQLLERLKHDKTIVYDLIFDTPEEEFQYLVKRREHFSHLLNKILENNTFSEQTLKLVQLYQTKSDSGAVAARVKKDNEEHRQASEIMEKSIKDLSTGLKILGIKF